ncbi:MAG TPA: carboxymuconolactone decarboxylase family protein [Gemmatimonadales bacterium]
MTAALAPPVVALVRTAAAIAKGGDDLVRRRMIAALAAQVPKAWMEELLLQSFLNAGYPLSLAAFGIWRELAGPVADAGEALDHRQHAGWEARGADACAVVYGRAYQKLLVNLRALHPAVVRLVIVDAYGKVLGRPGLDPRVRELCTLAAIAMLNAPRQLAAHFRGALNHGWSRDDVDAVLAFLEEDLGAERALAVWELWADVRERGSEKKS